MWVVVVVGDILGVVVVVVWVRMVGLIGVSGGDGDGDAMLGGMVADGGGDMVGRWEMT